MTSEEEIEYNLKIFKKELSIIENRKDSDKSKLAKLSMKCHHDLESLHIKAKKLKDQIKRDAQEIESLQREIVFEQNSMLKRFNNVLNDINSIAKTLKEHRQHERSKFIKVKSRIIDKINLLYPEYRRAHLVFWRSPMDRNKFRLR